MAGITGISRLRFTMNVGSASTGHMKPAEKIIGKEEKSMIGVAISRDEKSDPRNSPKAREAERKATPKVMRLAILLSLVTSKSSKL